MNFENNIERIVKKMSSTVIDVKLISLLECDQYSAAEVGLKAWRLMEVAKQGITVPPALVIPSAQVEKFLSEDDVDIPTVVSKFIWETCRQTFGASKLIVRSSGFEDGERFSFAGQFESVPEVTDSNSLQSALVKCISSSRSKEVKRYQEVTDDRPAGTGNFAVIIMPQRDCLISGIMFSSVNIDNGSANCTVLQIAQGTNFALTAGSSTGDIVYLDHNSGKLVYSIKDRSTAINYSPEHLSALHKLANQLEKLAGYAADIEWGILPDGTLETYQLRPITGQAEGSNMDLRLRVILQTVAMAQKSRQDLQGRGVSLSGNNVWSDQNIAELLTEQPSQFAFGLFTYVFAHGDGAIRRGRNEMGYAIGDELTDGFFELIGGRPRCSIVHDALTYRIAGIPLSDYVTGFVDRYLVKIAENQQMANYPEVVLYEQNPPIEQLIHLFGDKCGREYAKYYERFFTGIRILEQEMRKHFVDYETSFMTYIDQRRSELVDLSDFDIHRLVLEAQSLIDHLRTVSCVMFVKVARLGFFAYARLRNKLQKLFDGNEGRFKLDQVTAGLEGDASMLFNIRLAEVRDGKSDLAAVLKEFGHLGPNELEIANLRYHDQPELVLTMARNISGAPLADLRKRALEADAVMQNILERCDADQRDDLKSDIRAARRYLAMREMAKYYYLMEYDLLRRCLVQVASVLQIDPKLIFELDPRELPLIVDNPQQVTSLVTERCRRRQALAHLPIPQVISHNRVNQIGQDLYDPDSPVMYGIGITSMLISGTAVVVLDPNDQEALQRLQPGNVLVTKTTDPTWAPIIAAVGKGALVTEIGGPLAHGAIVARDLGIACVQNVPGVTKRIKTGDIIQVDGKNGTVTLIEESE